MRNGLTDRHTLFVFFPGAHFLIQRTIRVCKSDKYSKVHVREIKVRRSHLESTAVPQPYFAAQRNHSVASSTLVLRYYLSMQVASSLQRCRKVRVRHLRRSPKECSQGDPARTRTANVRNGLTNRHTLGAQRSSQLLRVETRIFRHDQTSKRVLNCMLSR